MADVRLWLEGLGLGQHADTFVDNGYDGLDVCADLTESDLGEIQVRLCL